MFSANEVRESFKEFFKSKGHQIVPSAPMVIKGDPTLMFTNAGMNQFKDIILGNAQAKYNRVADSQKCLRVSGKHSLELFVDLLESFDDLATAAHALAVLHNLLFGCFESQSAFLHKIVYHSDTLDVVERIVAHIGIRSFGS